MKKRQQKPTNITKMDNQYVRSTEQRKAAQRKASFYVKRRMLLLCIAAVLIFGGLIINIFDKKKELVEREKVEVEVAQRLEAVKQDQEILHAQVKKLEDDEYILKLARKEYFLSEEGEIIFTMPSDKKEKNEQEEEKNADE